MTTEEKEIQQIAEDYINGNLKTVEASIVEQREYTVYGCIVRALDVYEYLRTNYGQTKATGFSSWIRR